MKVKMFAVMALSSLMISTASFALPNLQYAEDNTSNTDMNMQSPSPTDNNGNENAPMPGQSNVGSMGGSSNSMDNNNNNASTDDMSADTATGDDDY